VDFKKGKTNATIRFADSESAAKVTDAHAAGQKTESGMTVRLLGGADERSYWEALGASVPGRAAVGAAPATVEAKQLLKEDGGQGTEPAPKKRKTGQLKAQRTHITFD
jgi:hypothetical protein